MELLERQLADEVQKRNAYEARVNKLKPLDELEKEKETLERKIEENRRIMNDKKSSKKLKQAAAVRFSENTDDLAGLEEQIQERQEALPLRERVRNIFNELREKLRENTTTLKKLLLQAIVLATGLVLGAVALAAMNGLKAATQAVGKGLKTIGQKLGSLLPGLIGSIVSFIFESAGQVLSLLGEHAWLLILAVVAFFMERLLKKRRKQ